MHGSRSSGSDRSLDLGRGDRHAVALLEDVVARHGLAVDADEVILRLRAGDLLAEELIDRGALGDVHVVGVAVKLSMSVTAHTRLQNRT